MTDPRSKVETLRTIGAPDPEQLALAEDPSPFVRKTLAERRELPPEVAERLANDPIAMVRAASAGNHRLPDELIEKLSGDSDERVRLAVATGDEIPPRVAERLARDSCALIRSAVARKDGLSRETIDALSSDPSASVRCSVSERSDLSENQIANLIRDEDRSVRASIASARNPTLSENAILTIAADRDDDVRAALTKRHGAIPDDVAEKLALDQNVLVRRCVAQRGDLSNRVAVILALATDERTRATLLINKQAPLPAILVLSDDESKAIRNEAAEKLGKTSAHERMAAMTVLSELDPQITRRLEEVMTRRKGKAKN
jgi:hypothetical protein